MSTLGYTLQNLMWAVKHDASEPTIRERAVAVEAAIRELIHKELVDSKLLAERDPLD